MAYGDLKLEAIFDQFGITTVKSDGEFAGVPPVEPSERLTQFLTRNVPRGIAMGTEKARSEIMIMPVLLEAVNAFPREISLFSGVEFNPAPELGLNGVCDFLISLASEQMVVREPVIAVVKAKNDNVKNGFGQCIAEMVGAQIFNRKHGKPLETVYGVSTTGTNWFFMRLVEKTIYTDFAEYTITEPGKLVVILLKMLHDADQEFTAMSENGE